MKDKGTENTLSFTLITCMAAANKQDKLTYRGGDSAKKVRG
jgi:hypothetical protein